MWAFSSEEVFITARKRSLGQGNMFTGASLSTGGVPAPGRDWSRGSWPRGRCLVLESVPAPRGMCLLPGGVPAPGGCLFWGLPGGDPPRWLLLRAACILLEGILVSNNFTGGYLSFKGSQSLPTKHTFSPWKLNNTKWVNMIPCFTPFAVSVNSK